MWFKKVISRLGRPFGISQGGNELDDELRFHLEKEVELNIVRGMSPEEARRQALIAFGGVQQTRESMRQVRWFYPWEVMFQDARYGLRMLRKAPGFTAVSVLILALGIGMNSAIFSFIDAILFRSLPIQDPQSLLLLRWQAHAEPKSLSITSNGDCPNVNKKINPSGCIFSVPFFRAAQQMEVFSSVAGFAGGPKIVLSGNGPATILKNSELVSGNYFQTLGVGTAVGRTLGPADDTPSAPPAMMLGYGYWQLAFGGDPGVVGRTVRLNGTPFTIVGVTERSFDSLTPARQFDVWLPLAVRPRLMPDWTPRNDLENFWWLVIVARPKLGISVSQAQAAITLLYRNQTVHGDQSVFKAADEPGIMVVPAQQGLEGSRNQILEPLYIMLFAVGLILLIACANVAGLLLARAGSRQKEVAVRLALGARRGRVVLQLLVENLTLSLMGAAAGLLVAHWGTRGMMAVINSAGENGPKLNPQLDTRVLLFTAAIAIVTGLIFGLIPAFRSLRLDLTPTLKNENPGPLAASRGHWYSLGNSLVVTQVALAMVALVAAGLLVNSLRSLKSVDLGFEPRNILVFGIDPTLAGYKDAQADVLYRDLQEEFAGIPGIASVSYSWQALLNGSLWTTDLHPHGAPEHETADSDYLPVGPGFFKTMKIPFQAGRDFTASDFAVSAAAVASNKAEKPVPIMVPVPIIVNEAFVHKYFPDVNPLGQHVEAPVPSDPKQPRDAGWQVVGVVGDAKYNQPRREINPTMYAPTSGGEVFFELRTQGDPKLLLTTIRNVVSRKDPNLALFRISTQLEQVDRQLAPERLLAQMSSLFGLVALVLACIGLYGLLSYEVGRRTREIGIRMAIGARRSNVIQMVILRGILLATTGAIAGVAASFAISRLLASMLYKVKPGDPATLAACGILLLLIALAACYMPARRATRVDPLVALRYE